VGVDHVVAVPRMDKEEVGEFAEALGCPDDRRLGWAGIVWISTGGHPQLSAVRLWALREQGWPSLSADTFLNAGVDAIASEKSDARQLAEGLPIAQRELLNRLSVFPVVFRRDHAIAIGATSPSIQAPGNAFDPLVGPWLEPLHAGCYSLSPLLADSALHSLSPQDLKTLRTEAARILLRTKPCSTTEGANAFMLLWQTRNVGCLAQLAQSFIDLRANVLADLAEQLVWFTLVGLQRGDKLFPEAPPVGLLLRSLQFRIALLSAPERAAEIVDAWYCEVECADCPEPALHHMLLAGHVLPHPQVLLSARVVVKLLREVSKAATAHPELKLPQSLPRDSESHLEYIPKWKDPVSTFSFFCSARCMTIDYLDEFLTALETIDPELRDRILRGFIGGNIEAQMAVDRTWLTQSKQQSPNWKQCLSVFKRTYTLGQAWQCSALATAAMRGICVVLDEYLEDHQSAHENLDQMESEGGLALHMIHDRRACIFLSEGKHEAAEEQWRLALASWPRQLAPFDTGAAFAARNAGLCAARQARWEPAAAWFMEIVWRIPSSNEAAFIAGAYADAAYCLWKAGRMGDALLQLIEAWKVAEELPSGPENLRAFITRKRVGHVIAWLHGKTTYRGICNLAEPQAGFCTSPELAEKMRELPETESGNVWFFLMRLERELDAGNRAAELAKATLKEVARPATQAMLAMEAIAQNMVSGDVMNLPAKILALKRAVHTAAQFESLLPDNIGTQGSPEIFVKGDTLCGAPALLAGLIAAESKGYSWRELLAQWRESLSGGVDDTWIKWFDTTEQILGGSTAAAGALARNPGEDWTGSLLASWLLLVSDQSSADEIFLAHARWLGVVDISCWFRDVAVAFCQQIELAWIRACSRPALLLQPRLNVPLIKLACTEGKRGLAKAARILLAGAPAVTERLAPEMEAAFRKLAQTQ
jgi:tetratricopeptide (TPR) repeat protein